MHLSVLCVLGLIVGISATCPANPREQAKKCGRTFRRFGATAHKDINKLRSLCPKVYRALDCLREITNDCEMYRRIGLTMSDTAYQTQKSTLDYVCKSAPETNEVLPNDDSDVKLECQSQMMTCGKIGKQMLKVSVPQQMCPIMSQMISCFEDLQTDCQSILPPNASASIADSKSKYQQMCVGGAGGSGASQMQCLSMLNDCSQKINEFGASGECSIPPAVTSCLDQLEKQCSDALPPGQVSQMRQGMEQFSAICKAGKNRGPGPVYPSSMEPEGERLPSIPANPQSQGAGGSLRMECMNMLNGCVQIMSGLGAQMDQACSTLPTLTACFDNVEARCSSILPAGQVDQMRGSLSGIMQMCEATHNQKRNAGAENECENMMMGCGSISSQILTLNESQSVCPILSQALTCYSMVEQQCADNLSSSFSNVISVYRTQYNKQCNSGPSSGLSPMQCAGKLSTCVNMMSNLNGADLCSGVAGTTSCITDVESQCATVLGSDQFAQMRNSLEQLSALCAAGLVSK